jgi:4-amino-4-deoxy-L-arabinose transferase-like glycosyltransferase
VLAAILYLYKLGEIPAGIRPDEVAFGYSAYSILKTGKDELGASFPILFQSYGDQKLPLYVYTLIPFINFFGLTQLSVRLPSAFAGIALIPIVYATIRSFDLSKKTALTAAFVTAFSPYTIFMARLGREAELGLVFFALGILLFAKYTFKNNRLWYGIFSAISFVLSWYSYVAYRLLVVLILPVFLVVFIRSKLLSYRQSALIITVFLTGILPSLIHGSVFTARVSQLGFSADNGPMLQLVEQRDFCNLSLPRLICALDANKITIYGRTLINNFLSIYSPEYLFTQGDPSVPVLNVDNYGQFFFITIPFFLIGLYHLFITRQSPVCKLIILGLLLTPLPGVFSGAPNKLRLTATMYFVILTIAIGFDYVLTLNDTKRKALITSSSFILFTIQLFLFNVEFFTVYANKYTMLYNSHVPHIMATITKYPSTTKIYLTDFFDDPVMYYAFYTKLNPTLYQNETLYFPTDSGGFRHARSLKNIEVTKHSYRETFCENQTTEKKVYITNQKNPEATPARTFQTRNKVHTLAYIYEEPPKGYCNF